jgi:drug/metabolite transporter (DMT)-like permease
VALLSPIFLKEPLRKPVLTGMILALAGGTVIALSDSCTPGWFPFPVDQDGRFILPTSRPSLTCPPISEFVQGKAFFGNFLALVGAWTVAGYLMIGRTLRARISLVPYIFIVFGSAAICLLVSTFFTGQNLIGFSPATYSWILLLALLPQLTSHSIYNWALRYLPASLVSTVTLTEPVGSAVLAWVILDEALTRLTILGGVLILAGIYIATSTKQTG